ncbi:Uncharacterised protein [Cedecea lapagei]|uniref:Uncharacterized protein n=1 Tax=Cedecea lapagei TaxID=158823 RepID=A0A3S4IE82_9ENTR|nr:hypothetical protein [Cedecea lapagei]VEB97707.1 Uncharacterised protein [Cedecea lapagei]
MKQLLLALCLLTPFKISLASVSGTFDVRMTILSNPLPPKVIKVKLSADTVMIVNEW